MRRDKYRIFLITIAIIIALVGIWCLIDLNTSNQVIEGTFVYGR